MNVYKTSQERLLPRHWIPALLMPGVLAGRL